MSNEFDLVGGRLCLDLANARTALLRADREDQYDALLRWGRQAGGLTEREEEALRRVAAERPADALAVFDRAARLAEAVENIFTALAESTTPDDRDLTRVNDELTDALCCRRLVAHGDGFEWDWTNREGELGRVLWPVAQSAADLLVSDDVGRVKMCDNHSCRWLFFDASKNGKRRWCDMAVCGNRAKARRYRERHRATT